MTVDQELDTAHAEYAEWTWQRILSVGWLITWRTAVIFVAIFVVGILVLSTGTPIEFSFDSSVFVALVLMGTLFFVLGVLPLTISAKMSTRKKYADFQIQILDDHGARLKELSFGQATRMGWLIFWRTTVISLVVTMVLALPLIMLGFYEIRNSGNQTYVATPWFIFLPIYLFALRSALLREYIGFHLVPVSFAENSTENHI